ncbi:MAG: hypothetical protein HC875_01950 [Anaerolineales bacterium]|nr:hypothetical protein [Anaerolineales bacterium]
MNSLSRWYKLNLVMVMIGLVLLTLACARLDRREPAAAETPPTPAEVHNVAPASGSSVGEIEVGGQTRRYRLHVPPDTQSGQAVPLVINLHGLNSNAEQQETVSRMSNLADRAGFIVVYPEGLGSSQNWKFGDGPEGQADVNFIRELIRRLQSQFNLDSRRIYATGISNGAEMSYRLACDLSDTIAAVGLVSGGYPRFACEPVRPVPVVVFHGTADNVLAYEGHPPLMLPVREWAIGWAARNGCAATPQITFQQGEVNGETWGTCREGATVTLYTITGKGHSWPGSQMPARITTQDINATQVIWEFFAAHPLP